jgi:prevent-host-death family protein
VEADYLKPEKTSDSPVRIIGSRDLHRNLPTILRELERREVRYVLTVHGKPRAVLVGAEPYLDLIGENTNPSEAIVNLQLSALMGKGIRPRKVKKLEQMLDNNGD